MNLQYLKFKGTVKGLFSSPIPYTPLLESGDSSPYFGTYEGQKFGNFDSSLCWDFSATELAETRLTMLRAMNLIPQDTLDWLKKNGYIDSDGDFYLSRRWVGILSGVRDNGNQQLNFWKIASVSGLIPNSMLPYDHDKALQFQNQNSFNNDYFNPSVITPEMKALGKEFLKRFKIQAENLQGGFVKDISQTLQTFLKEGSMQIGHPVPHDGSWNQQYVKFVKGYLQADHATECYKYDSTQDFPIYIYDSYNPNLKQLSKDYYIPFVTRVSIIPIQITSPLVLPQFSNWMKFWLNVKAFFSDLPLPYPQVPIGDVV